MEHNNERFMTDVGSRRWLFFPPLVVPFYYQANHPHHKPVYGSLSVMLSAPTLLESSPSPASIPYHSPSLSLSLTLSFSHSLSFALSLSCSLYVKDKISFFYFCANICASLSFPWSLAPIHLSPSLNLSLILLIQFN